MTGSAGAFARQEDDVQDDGGQGPPILRHSKELGLRRVLETLGSLLQQQRRSRSRTSRSPLLSAHWTDAPDRTASSSLVRSSTPPLLLPHLLRPDSLSPRTSSRLSPRSSTTLPTRTSASESVPKATVDPNEGSTLRKPFSQVAANTLNRVSPFRPAQRISLTSSEQCSAQVSSNPPSPLSILDLPPPTSMGTSTKTRRTTGTRTTRPISMGTKERWRTTRSSELRKARSIRRDGPLRRALQGRSLLQLRFLTMGRQKSWRKARRRTQGAKGNERQISSRPGVRRAIEEANRAALSTRLMLRLRLPRAGSLRGARLTLSLARTSGTAPTTALASKSSSPTLRASSLPLSPLRRN